MESNNYKVRNYKNVNLKRTKEFEQFEKLCQELGLKKATIINKLIENFVKNPEKFLLNK